MRAIITMAHHLGVKVVAEGVETKGQYKLLSQIACDYYQGYLFSKPVPSECFFETFILNNHQVNLHS